MKLVLHSISYAGLWKGQSKLSLLNFIRKAADLGFDGVELMAKKPHASLLDLDDNYRAEIRECLEYNKLECSCIAGYSDFTMGVEDAMIPSLEMQINYITDLTKLAHDLNCKLVRIFTGMEIQGIPYSKQWDLCVEGIKECAIQATKYGVTIGIQNHHDIAVDGESLSYLINEVNEPNCKIMFDAWAPALQELDINSAIDYVFDDLVFTTVADYIKIPRFHYEPDNVNYSRNIDRTLAVPMGEGIIDYKHFFSLLKSKGYDGPVSYEMCSKLRDGGSEEILDAYARKFLEYMRKLEKNVIIDKNQEIKIRVSDEEINLEIESKKEDISDNFEDLNENKENTEFKDDDNGWDVF